MDREKRILDHLKADKAKIVRRKPFDSEGHNGDIAIGNTASGVSLFSKINNKWHEFSSDFSMERHPRVKGTAWHFYEAGASDDHTFFMPLNGGGNVHNIISGGTSTDYSASHVLLLPFDTRVLTMSLWGAPVLGSVTVSVYNVPNGTRADSADTSQLIETSPIALFGTAHTTRTITFSGDYILKAGSGMYLRFRMNDGNQVLWDGQDEGDYYSFSFVLTLDLDVAV